MAYMSSFVGCFYGVLKTLGSEVEYSELLAVSGFGVRAVWEPAAWQWGIDQVSLYSQCRRDDLENRLLHMYQWEYKRLVSGKRLASSTANGCRDRSAVDVMRKEAKRAIKRGMPLVIRGLTRAANRKQSWGIFFGYEDNGNILLGYDYHDKAGAVCRISDWYKRQIEVIILLKQRDPPLTERRRALEALGQTIVISLHNIRNSEMQFGARAWDALAQDLEDDEDFANCTLFGKDEKDTTLKLRSLENRLLLYCDFLCLVHQRNHILPYLTRVAREIMPEFRVQILEAARLLKASASYAGYLWSVGLNFTSEGFCKLGDPAVRRLLAEECRRGAAQEAAAIRAIRVVVEEETRIATPTRTLPNSSILDEIWGLPT